VVEDPSRVEVAWRFAGQPIYDPVKFSADMALLPFKDQVQDQDVASRCNRFLMTRGRKPGTGAVLMLKRHLDLIINSQEPIHTLLITARNTVQIQKLCVTKAEAVFANITDVSGVTIKDTTPFIVEIADARFYANMVTVEEAFNLRRADGVRRSPQISYRTAVGVISDRLANIFGRDFLLQVPRISAEEFEFESLAFHCVSAWDALWVVLDQAGWSFTIKPDGTPLIFDPKEESETQEIMDSINESMEGRRTRWDTGAELIHVALPEKITVCTRQRDYQFYQDRDARTRIRSLHSGDYAELRPVFSRTFETRFFLSGKEKEGKQFINDADQVIWATVPLLTDDQGQSNENEVLDHLRVQAQLYVKRIANLHRGVTWQYSVVHGFFPNSHIAAVGFSDVGGRFVQTVAVGEDEVITWKGDQLGWDAELARPGSPNTRSNVPYGREMYGVLFDHSPAFERDSGEEIPPLGDGRPGLAFLLSGHTQSEGEVVWVERATVVVINGTGRPIRMNQRIYAKWNYQVGRSGTWIIVSVGGAVSEDGDKADWVMECLDGGVASDRVRDSGVITVDKERMIKLVSLGGASLDPEDPLTPVGVGISFFAGPINSILQTRSRFGDDAGRIEWTTGPSVNNINVGNWVKFGGGPVDPGFDAPGNWLGGPRGGSSGVRIRLPTNPGRSHLYLRSGPTSGNCTELTWSGPGLDCSLQYLDCYEVCQTMLFSNGLLVSASVSVEDEDCKIPDPQFGASCLDVEDENFNPCDTPGGFSNLPGFGAPPPPETVVFPEAESSDSVVIRPDPLPRRSGK